MPSQLDMPTLQFCPKSNSFKCLCIKFNTKFITRIINYQKTKQKNRNIPRKAREEKQCKTAQKQHMTIQRTKRRKIRAGTSAKTTDKKFKQNKQIYIDICIHDKSEKQTIKAKSGFCFFPMKYS